MHLSSFLRGVRITSSLPADSIGTMLIFCIEIPIFVPTPAITSGDSLHQWHPSLNSLYQWHTSLNSLHQWYTSLNSSHEWHTSLNSLHQWHTSLNSPQQWYIFLNSISWWEAQEKKAFSIFWVTWKVDCLHYDPYTLQLHQAIYCKVTFDTSLYFLKFLQNFVPGTNFGGNSKWCSSGLENRVAIILIN